MSREYQRRAAMTAAMLPLILWATSAAHGPDIAVRVARSAPSSFHGDSLVARGRALFVERACLHCHAVAGYGGQMGPDLLGVGQRRSQEWLIRHFLEPDSLVPSTLMPPQGPDSVARALAAFVATLSTPADAMPVIGWLLAADSMASRYPAARLDVSRVGDRLRVLRRLSARDSLLELAVESAREQNGTVILRYERYEPYGDGRGWRRYLDDIVYLQSADLTLDSALQVMDGVTHRVWRSGPVFTLSASRPLTRRGWTESRRLPASLSYASDAVLAAIQVEVGDTVRLTSFGLHGGHQHRLVSRAPASMIPGADRVVHAVTLGSTPVHRWLAFRRGEHIGTYHGSVPGSGSRTVPAGSDETVRLLRALVASDTAEWVTITAPGAQAVLPPR